MDVVQTREAYVDNQAERLIAAAGMAGQAAELTRASVKASYAVVVAQFEANERLVPGGSLATK